MKDAFFGAVGAVGSGAKGAWNLLKKGAEVSWDTIRSVPEEKNRAVALLNGLVGDQLAARKLDLAIQMGFVKDGEPIALGSKAIKAAHKKVTDKVCILVHGSCDSEETWEFQRGSGVDYG